MKIEEIEIEKIKQYKLNAKRHPQAQIEGLAESIRRFGFTQPIVVDKNNEIIIGHGRLAGAHLAGLNVVPCLKMEELKEQEVRALRLIDNRIAETGWDTELLIEDLSTIDFNMQDFKIDFDFALDIDESFSQKNQEIDVNEFDDFLEIKLKFNKEQFDFINNYFQNKNDKPENLILELIKNDS